MPRRAAAPTVGRWNLWNRSHQPWYRTARGILAADESIATMSARLAAAGVAPTEENRRAYREMLVTTPGLSSGISGVILCDETLRQRLGDGRPFPAALGDLGLLPGIKVDQGAHPLAGAPGETVTEGLDGLLPRLREYASSARYSPSGAPSCGSALASRRCWPSGPTRSLLAGTRPRARKPASSRSWSPRS